jgi:WD40 repeat protein
MNKSVDPHADSAWDKAAFHYRYSRAPLMFVIAVLMSLMGLPSSYAQFAPQTAPVEIIPSLFDWSGANAIAISPNGQWFASGASTIKLWDFGSGRLIRTLDGHPGGLGVTALTFQDNNVTNFRRKRRPGQEMGHCNGPKIEFSLG